MQTQSEQALENELIDQLQTLGFDRVHIADDDLLVANLKTQLEKHNRVTLSDAEFKQVLIRLSRGNVFEKAKTLREKVDYQRDDGTFGFLELINQEHWCKNQYQVTNQITMRGKYDNRYDVTLLVNGLPLAQIELKRRGLEMKEAFNQIVRYHQHSYAAGHGLFGYVQLFVISNGVNTKYFANNPPRPNDEPDFKQTFFWADKENKKITKLDEFAKVFLEKCQLSKLITKYIVLNETEEKLFVLRPYQYYAVEEIVEQVKESNQNGYIWHTTGSGKTLTSFKASQILTKLPEVHKVVFVVDRKDLDFQTIREFEGFQKGSVTSTASTKQLVDQFVDDTPLIVTTLQKLNTAISKDKHLHRMESLADKRIVFIFDECHRSQFGETHKRITEYFKKSQMFGFTGTPIFEDNAAKNDLGKRTTKDLFGKRLHQYVITDAIRDENVLKFSVEYIRTVKQKESVADIEVEAIDTAEAMEAPERLNNITNWIIQHHGDKTHNRDFTAIFCVSNVKTLIKYYNLFKQKKEAGEHDLKIGTIFSYNPNEDSTGNGGVDAGDEAFGEREQVDAHTREHLDQFIADYNQMFGGNESSKDFEKYYKDISKRVKNREIDILLVVNMFLTGFDSKWLNTIYVDKNLKYHGLLQAYSRTNRLCGTVKSQGNVVCFRNLKPATDEAISLFANKQASEDIFLAPYEDYLKQFEAAYAELLAITPTVESVDLLVDEDDEAKFILAFRAIARLMNILECFTEFDFDDLPMDPQTFADFKSKYGDLNHKVKQQKEKVSILNDIDFEMELITNDKINVAYIISLLRNLKDKEPKEQEAAHQNVRNLLESEVNLRSKKELIEEFIAQHLPNVDKGDSISDVFAEFWDEKKQSALNELAETESLSAEGLEKIISDYLFSDRLPLRDDVVSIMNNPPRLRERKTITERVIESIREYVETFIDGMG